MLASSTRDLRVLILCGIIMNSLKLKDYIEVKTYELKKEK